jgi:hypothetical protein
MPDPHADDSGDPIDPVQRYLDEVMARADLSASDQRRVRGELEDHIRGLVESQTTTTPKEILIMLHEQFGEPKQLGQAIATSRGRVRTYLKKKARRLTVSLAVALVLFFSVRCAVAQAFYVPSDAAAPAIPKGSRCLVYKWTSTYRPGDVVVFRDTVGLYMIGTVREVRDAGNTLLLSRNRQVDRLIGRSDVVGRVVANTR